MESEYDFADQTVQDGHYYLFWYKTVTDVIPS